MKISIFLKKHIRRISGITAGAMAGYAYYFFIGCTSGSCPISSNPFISVIYGALLGYLIVDMFKKKKSETD